MSFRRASRETYRDQRTARQKLVSLDRFERQCHKQLVLADDDIGVEIVGLDRSAEDSDSGPCLDPKRRKKPREMLGQEKMPADADGLERGFVLYHSGIVRPTKEWHKVLDKLMCVHVRGRRAETTRHRKTGLGMTGIFVIYPQTAEMTQDNKRPPRRSTGAFPSVERITVW